MDANSTKKRRSLIKKIEKERKSKVIAYVTSDRPNLSAQIWPDVVSVIHEHILALNEGERDKLDLFIYSRGGASNVPWTLVSMFRQYAKEGSFSVLIPYRAHSAATVIALGADEIVMTKKAELGPIDATIPGGPYNPTDSLNNSLPLSVEDVMGYFSLLEKVCCVRPDEKMRGFELLTTRVHPLALGSVSRILDETKLVASLLLNTRAEPFTQEQNREIIDALSSKVFSHDHAINRDEAYKKIGLKQVKEAEKISVANELWELYEEYKSLFLLEDIFRDDQELISGQKDENSWKDLKIACVESLNRCDTCSVERLVRKVPQQQPPQINVSLANLVLPTINIPTLPPGMDAQGLNTFIEQIVKQSLNQFVTNAAVVATQKIIKSLPFKIERAETYLGWKKEANHGD